VEIMAFPGHTAEAQRYALTNIEGPYVDQTTILQSAFQYPTYARSALAISLLSGLCDPTLQRAFNAGNHYKGGCD